MRRGAVIIIGVGILFTLLAVGVLFFLLQGGGPGVPGLPQEEATEGEEDAGPPPVDVVFADVNIPARTVITDTTVWGLRLEPIPAEQFAEQGATFFTNPADVTGKVTLVEIQSGGPVRRGDLAEPGLSQQIPPAEDEDQPRPKAFPIEVSNVSGVADQIQVGDFVDVVATYAIPIYVQVDENRVEERVYYSTKTIIQRAEVLRIVRPRRGEEDGEGAPPPEAEPAEAPAEATGDAPETDAGGRPAQAEGGPGPSTITTGNWTVVVAITNQEIEAVEFTNQRPESFVALALRGAGDEDEEETFGATIDLMLTDFGVPLPLSAPFIPDAPNEPFDTP